MGLAEQPRFVVPRAVVAVPEPAPVRLARQQYPDRFAQCTGQMGNRGVDTDDQVQRLDELGGIGKVNEASGRMANARIRFEKGLVDGGDCILQQQQGTMFLQRRKEGERRRTLCVGGQCRIS